MCIRNCFANSRLCTVFNTNIHNYLAIYPSIGIGQLLLFLYTICALSISVHYNGAVGFNYVLCYVSMLCFEQKMAAE